MIESTFSWKARLKSFQFAGAGFKRLLKYEHNARLHVCSTLLCIVASVILKPSLTEVLLLVLVTALVWICEIFNSCIEKAMDFMSTEWHPSIKAIKDMAAAAVLLASVAAFIIGCIVFIPKMYHYVLYYL